MRQLMVLCCSLLALSLSTLAQTAEPETVDSATDARLLLARRELTKNEKGIYILASETKLGKHLDWIGDMQKGIPTAVSALAKFQKEYRTQMQAFAQYDQQFQTLTAQSNSVPPAQKKQFDAVMKDVTSKRAAAKKEMAEMPQHYNTHELAVGASRKGLIDGIMLGMKQITEVEAQYEKMKKDPLVDKSLKMLAKSDKVEISLGPGAEFKEASEKIKKLESQLIREEIPLEAEGDGKILTGEIEINGKHKIKFQVHPVGRATVISEDIAKQIAVMPTALTPKVNYTSGKDRIVVPEITLNTMELGELKATAVRTLVLSKTDFTGMPTLGPTFFLGRAYSVDVKAKKLKITRLKDEK